MIDRIKPEWWFIGALVVIDFIFNDIEMIKVLLMFIGLVLIDLRYNDD